MCGENWSGELTWFARHRLDWTVESEPYNVGMKHETRELIAQSIELIINYFDHIKTQTLRVFLKVATFAQFDYLLDDLLKCV